MKVDPTTKPYKLASSKILKILGIKPHGVTKVSSFEAHMDRKPNTSLSNLATTSSPNNFNWESAIHACLDRKNLTKPPLPDEIMHDLQHWSEDDVSTNERQQEPQPQPTEANKTATQTPGAKGKRNIEINIDKMSIRYKGLQTSTDKNK